MSTFLSFFAMILTINPHFTKGIEWTVDQKAFTYGQNLTLFCTIDNCCFYTAGWDRWNGKELTPIYIDVRNLKDDSGDKYGGKANKSGIFLTIRDVKEVDLNTEYSCSYDFNVSKKKIVQKTDAFKDLKWIVDQRVSSYGHDLTLFCDVGTCCEYQYRWSKWKSVSNITPKNINEDKDINGKYNEKVNNSGFFLTIRNLREDDLNKEYACVYNNRLGTRKNLLIADAFYISEESSITSTPHIVNEKGKEPLRLDLGMVILFGVLVVVLLILVVFLIRKVVFPLNAPNPVTDQPLDSSAPTLLLVDHRNATPNPATDHPLDSSAPTLVLVDHRNATMTFPVQLQNSPSSVPGQNTSSVLATRPLPEGDRNTEMTYQLAYVFNPINLPKAGTKHLLMEQSNAEPTYLAPLPNSPSSVPENNISSASATQPLLEEDNNI